MGSTVISSGTLPKSSSSIADMFLANTPYLDPNVAKQIAPMKIPEVAIIGAAIFLIIFFVKKVV